MDVIRRDRRWMLSLTVEERLQLLEEHAAFASEPHTLDIGLLGTGSIPFFGGDANRIGRPSVPSQNRRQFCRTSSKSARNSSSFMGYVSLSEALPDLLCR